MRSIRLPLILALLLGCGPSPETRPAPRSPTRNAVNTEGPRTPTGDRRSPTALESGVIERLVGVAESIRGLEFARPVPVEIHSPSAIAEHLDREIHDADLAKAKVVYGALGLLPADLDLRQMIEGVMAEQVVGYYDLEAGKLVIRDETAGQLVSRAGGSAARTVIVHELVHALQDQRLGLGETTDREHDSDVDNALKALTEGDATLAMLVYQARERGLSFEELAQSSAFDNLNDLSVPASDDALGRAPAILRYTLIIPYVAGLSFVRSLMEGDDDWRDVNAAFRQLPTSTEQILHPHAYQRRENPDSIVLPAFDSLGAAGWTLVEEDTLGELELGVFLGRGTSNEYDPSAAEGWGGDRLRVYSKPDGGAAVVWFTSWDEPAEALEAARAAGRDSTQSIVVEGRAMLVLRGVPTELEPDLRSAFSIFAAALPARPPRGVSNVAP